MTARALFVASALTLALTACSGKAPEATETAAADGAMAEAAPAAEAAAPAAPAPSATPAAAETPAVAASPTPTSTPSAAPVAKLTAKPAAAPMAAPVAVAAATPPAAFTRCAVCHTADKGGADKLGPNLYGVYGQKAGKGGFAFSDALKASGLTFNDATLDKWIENPRALVPGNMMSFPGIKDPAKRQEIIAYLKKQS